MSQISGPSPTGASFMEYGQAAEIHFSLLAGQNSDNFRAGLLKEFRRSKEPAPVAAKIASDIITSASRAIAVSKVHLLRAAVSLEDSEERRRDLLGLVRSAVLEAESTQSWRQTGGTPGRTPALTSGEFQTAAAFAATVAERRIELPAEVLGTNAMLPNRPLAGWEQENATAVERVLEDLSRAGALFLDRLSASSTPRRVALKIELNMGLDGPPSVSDPVVTGAVLYELLERGFQRGVTLHFTVGDSCGIENAPVGRTSMDIMRDTGNYHHALKAGLRFVLRRDPDPARRESASRALNQFGALESMSVPAFFGSAADRVTSAGDVERVEAIVAPWVRCVDYDETGFVPVRPDLSPLGLAVWGTRDFEIARPWVEADHRVHVTRGCSTHLFAGWTGSLKGLIGLHALGLRPGDQGMNERGETALDLLSAMMHLSGFSGVIARRSGVHNLSELASQDSALGSRAVNSETMWKDFSTRMGLTAGWKSWVDGTFALEAELRQELRAGQSEVQVLAKMRRRTREILQAADRRSPGFRDALWAAVAGGTRSGLLTAWKFRSLLPATMRDERMGMRIGLLAQLPLQAELIVQGLPKIGTGGGPDAYESVRDVGIVVAGTDEVAVDLVALRSASVPGNPWAYNYPIYGALQFGRGPALWEEIKVAPPSA